MGVLESMCERVCERVRDRVCVRVSDERVRERESVCLREREK